MIVLIAFDKSHFELGLASGGFRPRLGSEEQLRHSQLVIDEDEDSSKKGEADIALGTARRESVWIE